MENLPIQYLGYTPLFFLSIVTQVVIPVPLDLVVLGMFALNFNPLLVIFLSTAGLSIGATLTYIVGRGGLRKLKTFKKFEKTKKYHQAKRLYNKYGRWTLLFCFLPGIGKYFPLFAGIMNLHWGRFLMLFIVGRVIYYLILLILVRTIM